MNGAETFLSNKTFEALRIQLGIKTKRRRTALKSLRMWFRANGMWEKHKVPAKDYPLAVVLPVFPGPTILEIEPPEQSNVCEFKSLELWRPEVVDMVCRKHKAKDWYVRHKPTNPVVFARFLAKLAHAYCCAEIGPHGFRPLLLPAIEGTPDFPICRFVGGTGVYKRLDERHALELATIDWGGNKLWTVTVNLFNDLGFPEYLCVVGSDIDAPPIEIAPITEEERRPWRIPLDLKGISPPNQPGRSVFVHPGNYEKWLDSQFSMGFGNVQPEDSPYSSSAPPA
nr:hypothetical protein [uncultured Celeribacter sp.]